MTVRSALGALLRAWNAFWFAPRSALDLAACRLVICLAFLEWLRQSGPPWDDMSRLSHLSRDHLHPRLYRPRGFFDWLDLQMIQGDTLNMLWVAAVVGMVLTAAGFATRLSSLVFGVAGLYVVSLSNMWGKVDHSHNVMGMCLLILPLAASGHALSIDAWWRRRRGRPLPEPDGRYQWPIQLYRIAFASMLFFASWNKLNTSGWSWVDSPSLRNMILSRGTLGDGLTVFGEILASSPLLWKPAAAMVIAGQLTFFLILFVRHPVLRGLFFASGLGFLLGLWLVMRLPNPNLMVMLMVFIDWTALIGWVRARTGGVPVAPA